MEPLSLIDVAAEDDLLLDLASPQPLHPDPPRAGGVVVAAEASGLEPSGDSPEAGRVVDPDGATEEAPEQSESPRQRKAKGGVNLRKSLAWDSAFFTSEGVLDTEELAVVNSTFRKAQDSRLPGIAEEMRRSGESTTSTLESESWVLESLETELFDNVRASIQRSLGNPGKAPSVTAVTSKPSKSKANVPCAAARKGVDLMPQCKIRPPISTGQGVAGGKQRPQATLKEPTAARVKAFPGSTEVKPSLKPPRALPRVATMGAPTNTVVASVVPAKRSSTGVVNRQTVTNSVNSSVSTHSRSGGVTKSSSTSKTGALPSPSSSSTAASIGNMLGQKTKPSTVNNKGRTAQRIPIRSTSRTDINKVNPARASRNNIPSRDNSNRVSPSISPSSSVDSLSSVVSGASTASTVGKMSHTSASFSISPSLGNSNERPPTRADAATQGKSSKPSGLRMPTPKIGYFDAEKSIDQHIGAQMQLQPKKIQCSPRRSSAQMGTPASSILSQPESRPAASPHEKKGSLRSKASPLLPLEVAQIDLKPSQAMEHEACTPQPGPVVAADTAKENIPALHQNIPPNDGAGSLAVDLICQRLSSISLGDTIDLVS